MTPELTYLVWSVVLLIVHIVAQAAFGAAAKGADDQQRSKLSVAQRIDRALANYLQTYPAFVALALLLAVTNSGTALSAIGAAVWFWARVAYVPIYASGVQIPRSLCWFVSIIGLLMMLWPLLVA